MGKASESAFLNRYPQETLICSQNILIRFEDSEVPRIGLVLIH